MLLVKNLVDGTIYASGEDEDELINSWNKNIKKNQNGSQMKAPLETKKPMMN